MESAVYRTLQYAGSEFMFGFLYVDSSNVRTLRGCEHYSYS